MPFLVWFYKFSRLKLLKMSFAILFSQVSNNIKRRLLSCLYTDESSTSKIYRCTFHLLDIVTLITDDDKEWRGNTCHRDFIMIMTRWKHADRTSRLIYTDYLAAPPAMHNERAVATRLRMHYRCFKTFSLASPLHLGIDASLFERRFSICICNTI